MADLIVHMLWVQGELSRIEQLSIVSFLKNDYQVKLWTYGDCLNAPNGTIVADGREVLPENKIFTYKNGSYAAFSNLFRYELLCRFGGMWSDADVVAVKPRARLPLDDFLVSERSRTRPDKVAINGCLILCGQRDKGGILEIARDYARSVPKQDLEWGQIGPRLISRLVVENPDHGFQLMAPEFCNPVNWWDAPGGFLKPFVFPGSTFFVHLFNEMWRRTGIDKNGPFPENSLISNLFESYM